MNLLIVSNMEHYRDADDSVWGWGPTVQEIDVLSTLFTQVKHIGCLHEGSPSKSSLPYETQNLEFIGVPPAGGPTLWHKIAILRLVPLYLRTIWRELSWADVVHVRCPANIPLLAILLLAAVRHPKQRWVKYAGNWRPGRIDRYSYTFQRWWLTKNFSRALVTINGEWPGQPQHVYSFFNPCLSDEELVEGRQCALNKVLTRPLRILFVGALNEAKGVGRALHVMAALKAEGVEATLDLVGDGPGREQFENMGRDLKVDDRVHFQGWRKRTDLNPFLAEAHIMLFPSSTEGWPKVLSEAMAYGVVPLAGAVSSIPQYLERFGCGRAIPADNTLDYVAAIKAYMTDPRLWKKESQSGVIAAVHFSYTAYHAAVENMLGIECQ